MSNTPSDAELFALIDKHFGLKQRAFDTVIDPKTGRFHDAARYRDFAAAVLAKWGAPQPVVREPLPKFSALKFHARRDQKATVTLLFKDADTANAWVECITQKGGSNG
jgi:hypothetical protein